MNERIRELAYQAEDLADAEVDSGSEFHPAFCRIFAELLVQECVDRIKNTDMTDLEGPDPDDVLWLVEKQIKEHFGVK